MNKIIKIDKFTWLFAGIAVVILWQMLLPGYVLTLDMVFVPDIKVVFNETGFNNALPMRFALQLLNLIIPAWLIQKIVLFLLFFGLGYLPFKFLPLPKSKDSRVRLFTTLVYMANPFVYSRFLAGQWTHLVAYALLPVLFNFLFKFKAEPNFKNCFKLFLIILCIGIFSLHFLLMSLLIVASYLFVYLAKYLLNKDFMAFGLTVKNLLSGALIFLLLSLYWLIPALQRTQTIEQKFDVAHWEAFAASGHNGVPVVLNVLSLNGFWGEAYPWSQQFAWSQDYPIFWIAIAMFWVLILIGVVNGLKYKKYRPLAATSVIIFLFAFVFATGASETPFRSLNIWFYEHIPFWNGFRDSQKFGGLLALSYIILAGLGLELIITTLQKKNLELANNIKLFVLLIPITMGLLMWWGFKGQIQSVWYPDEWYKAKTIIQQDRADYRTLILPWHGYLSLSFNHNILTSNPARAFFGEQTVMSRSVELGEIYHQESDSEYISLDQIITRNFATDNTYIATIDALKAKKIKYIIYLQDLKDVDNLKYEFLNSSKVSPIIETKALVMYKIN